MRLTPWKFAEWTRDERLCELAIVKILDNESSREMKLLLLWKKCKSQNLAALGPDYALREFLQRHADRFKLWDTSDSGWHVGFRGFP